MLISLSIVTIFYARTDMQIQQRYATVAREIHQKTQTLIDEQKEAVLLVALSMGNDSNVREALQSNQPDQIRLNELAKKLSRHTSLKNLWFQVVKKNGDSFYRSWTSKRGDNLLRARLDIAKILEFPDILSSISTGKFDLTFKTMVPVYEAETLLGIFEVIATFNSIAEKLAKEDINPIFLVDKSYKKQLTKSLTRKFVNDYYVANINAKEKYLQLIQNNHPESYIKPIEKFVIDEQNELLVIYFALPDIKNNAMGHFILFKSFNKIVTGDIYDQRNSIFLYIALLAILLFVIIRYISNLHLTHKINDINQQLEEKISSKNRELLEQGAFLQSVMDGVSDSVMVIDKDYNVSLMNKVAKKIWVRLGYLKSH